MKRYQPPITITPAIASLLAETAERIGRLSVQHETEQALRLRRINRIRTIHGSLAIEGNTLSEEQITAILDGKHVLAPPREIQEVHNALAAYDQLPHWQPQHKHDLLAAHGIIMKGLLEDAGHYRRGGVGVMAGDKVIHMAPPANRVQGLMQALLDWVGQTDLHPLLASSVFHYEFEFIHPFADGNGRMGRLWQTLILSRWNLLLAYLPVESLIYDHQAAYYQALRDSTQQADSAPFIEFMLTMIRDASVPGKTGQVTGQVAGQVAPWIRDVLAACSASPQPAKVLQAITGIKHRETFQRNYLDHLLTEGWLERTIPDKPTSRLQQYRLTEKGQATLR